MSIQNEGSERTVVIGSDISEQEARDVLSGQRDIIVGEGAVPKFVSFGYRSFKAEFSTINDDLILHFFLPKHATIDSPESRQAWMGYWLKLFPEKLDVVAQEYFEAGYPRLMAKYTDEVTSWWFKAQGFGMVIDAEAFVRGFLEKLDEALQVHS